MLNEHAGVIDDLMVYYFDHDNYRLVVNAATRQGDLKWISQQAQAFKNLTIRERDDLSMLAVQGPQACELVGLTFDPVFRQSSHDLKPFHSVWSGDMLVARTGYTGEDGFEILLPHAQAVQCWEALLKAGVKPCGLGARDTLRLEAGLNLYGHDMDTQVTPLESNLAWTVAFEPAERDFIGRRVLEKQRKEGISHKLVGLVLKERAVLREGQVVMSAAGEGVITSGSFSPTINASIALARIPATATGDLTVDIRGRRYPVNITRPPFVKAGKATF